MPKPNAKPNPSSAGRVVSPPSPTSSSIEPKSPRFFWPIISAIFLCATYLTFVGLDHAYFWDDEAEVGIVAKNYLNTGQLTGWDRRNLFAYHNGTLLDQNMRPTNPPLHYFVAAAGFKLFGVSTWAGRFPFVLFGLGTLILFALILRDEFRGQPALAIYSFATLALSVGFLLHIRQCRYFALTVFFAVLTFYFYRRCLEKKNWIDFVWLGISAAIFFYAQYLLCASFLLALGLVHLVFAGARTARPRENLTDDQSKSFSTRGRAVRAPFVLAAGIFLIATVPYAIKYKIWFRPDLGETDPWLTMRPKMLWTNLTQLNELNFMPWMVFTALVFFLFRERRNDFVRRKIFPWIVFSGGYVFFLSLLTQVPKNTDVAPNRYLFTALPFLAVMSGAAFWFLHRHAQIVGTIALAAILGTNVFGLAPGNNEFRSLLPAYISEVHHEYPTSYRAAAEFINANCEKDANVFAYPEFCTYPLMFYCGDKVRFGCSIDVTGIRSVGEIPPSIPRATLDRLNAPLYFDQNFPDYFVAFGMSEDVGNLLEYFSRPHEQNGREVKFNYRPLTNLNVFAGDTSRPELTRHTFGPKTDFNRDRDSVVVFKRAE